MLYSVYFFLMLNPFFSRWGVLLCATLLFCFGWVQVSPVEAGMCDCACVSNGGGRGPGGPTCTVETECSYSACSTHCSNSYGMGYRPERGGRALNPCIGGASVDSPIANEPDPVPAPASQPRTGTGTGTTGAGTAGGASGGSGSGGAAPQTGGGTTPDGTPAPTGAGGALRFALPTCTETGNCSLTDVMNTGIRVANFLMGLAGVLFIGIVLWAGAQLLLFAHEAKSITSAQTMIKEAMIGIIIIMIAGVAVRFVASSLGVGATFTRLPGRMQGTDPAPAPRPSIFRSLGPTP